MVSPSTGDSNWAEQAERGPCYDSFTGPTAAPVPILPLGFAPTRCLLLLWRSRLKRQLLSPAHQVCLWESTGTGNGTLPVSATDTLVPAHTSSMGELQILERWGRAKIYQLVDQSTSGVFSPCHLPMPATVLDLPYAV